MSRDKKLKNYVAPEITRVKLEDRRVVAMAVCKDALTNTSCSDDGVTPTLTINAS